MVAPQGKEEQADRVKASDDKYDGEREKAKDLEEKKLESVRQRMCANGVATEV